MRSPGALSISILQWLVGVLVATMGALMLIAPHQFATAPYAQLSPQLAWFGPGFLLSGAGLLVVATPGLRFRYVLLAHLAAGGMLLFMAWGFALAGSWSGTSNYGVLGLGTAIAPVLGRFRPERGYTRGDAFSLLIGLATTITGLLLIAMPAQFSSSLYDPIRALLPLFGLAFVVAGSILSLSQIGLVVPSRLDRWSPLPVAAVLLLFGSIVAVPNHIWTGIAYYGGFGTALVILVWIGPRLRQLDPGSFRTRLALALATTAAAPVLLLAPIYSHEEESKAVDGQLALQQSLATALARDLSKYVALHEAAVKALATQPGLLALNPGAQHQLLQGSKAAYADIDAFGIVAGSGQQIAQSDDRQDPSWLGDPVFEETRRTSQPSLDIRNSPVLNRPVFMFGAPIIDADGQFSGMVNASLETSRVADFITRNDLGDGAHAYLSDATGRVIAHPYPDQAADFTDLAGVPSMVALLSEPLGRGSQRVAGPRGEVLASFARVPDLGLSVVVERSSAAALATTRAKLDLLFGGLILLIAVSAGFGLVAAGWLSRPLVTLAAAVDGLAAGEDRAPLPVGGLTEVARMASAFGTMRARVVGHTTALEKANNELEAFSYSVSHDLRAPLRAINGFSRILMEEHASELAPEARRYMELVRDNAAQMGALIDDLLNFSRLGRQELRKTSVRPGDVARDALNDLAVELDGRRVEVIVGELPPCQADAALLRQVFVNLLSNALKFTRARPVGHVEIGFKQVDGEAVYFVKDDGAGFDMRYAHKLFGVFERLHSTDEFEGTGVGLAIVQRIVHRHGGRVWATGDLNHGATFFFTLGGTQTDAPVISKRSQGRHDPVVADRGVSSDTSDAHVAAW